MNEKKYTTRIHEGTFQRMPCLACTRRFRPNIVRVELVAWEEAGTGFEPTVIGFICPQCLEAGPDAMAPKLHLQQERLRDLELALEKCNEWVTPGELAAAEEKIDERYRVETPEASQPINGNIAEFEDIPF